ncbi:MAG: hypothetical protein AYK18_17225 [Theionarchaea archaeon DG-70]|nr:MAG: hypothetical protein AYK18_17225 [Theionarchaea archaeon DG-70]
MVLLIEQLDKEIKKQVLSIIKDLQDQNEIGAPIEKVFERAREQGIHGEAWVHILKEKGYICEPNPGFLKLSDLICILLTIEDLDNKNDENGAHLEDILKHLNFMDPKDIKQLLRKLKHFGDIYEPRENHFKLFVEYDELFKELEESVNENSHKRNFKYENSYVHFTIQDHVKNLYDLEDAPEDHCDGIDSKYKDKLEIKSVILYCKNYIHTQDKTYYNAGEVIFYLSTHEELMKNGGSYLIIVYSFKNGIIYIHAQKKIPAPSIDHLIRKSNSKEKIGIRWTKFFENVSEIPLYAILESSEISKFRNEQIQWLKRLQDISVISIKVARNCNNKTLNWQLTREVKFPVNHRTVLHNEVVFDLDFWNWKDIKRYGNKLVETIQNENIPFLLAYTGGKGLHIHVFFNIPNLPGFENYTLQEIRMKLAKKILRKAEIEEKLIGKNKPFDTSCINWSDTTKGHLIRIFGGKNKSFKTLISEIPEFRPYIPYDQVIFPQGIELWNIPNELIHDFVVNHRGGH